MSSTNEVITDNGSINILIICPSLLEAATKRGGGIEEIDYQVALQISKYFNVSIIGPFYKRYFHKIYINDKFFIEEICFPAIKYYPPKSRLNILYLIIVLEPIYSCLLLKRLVSMKIRPKIIIVHNGLIGFLSTLIAKIMNVQVIYSEGNTMPWVTPYLVQQNKSLIRKLSFLYLLNLGKFIGIFSDSIRVQSNSIRQGMIMKGINPTKITTISGGVDVERFKPSNQLSLNKGIIRIGFVGRLTDEKGAPLLLEIIRLANKELPNIRFIVMGDGPYKSAFDNLPNVEHVGWILRDKLNLWLSKVQILLFFQRELGLAEIESMASGKTIIACNMGEVPQTIKHLENGVLCEPTPQSYICAIRYLYNNIHMIEKLSKNSRETAVGLFDWNKIGQEWYSLLKEHLDKKVG